MILENLEVIKKGMYYWQDFNNNIHNDDAVYIVEKIIKNYDELLTNTGLYIPLQDTVIGNKFFKKFPTYVYNFFRLFSFVVGYGIIMYVYNYFDNNLATIFNLFETLTGMKFGLLSSLFNSTFSNFVFIFFSGIALSFLIFTGYLFFIALPGLYFMGLLEIIYNNNLNISKVDVFNEIIDKIDINSGKIAKLETELLEIPEMQNIVNRNYFIENLLYYNDSFFDLKRVSNSGKEFVSYFFGFIGISLISGVVFYLGLYSPITRFIENYGIENNTFCYKQIINTSFTSFVVSKPVDWCSAQKEEIRQRKLKRYKELENYQN